MLGVSDVALTGGAVVLDKTPRLAATALADDASSVIADAGGDVGDDADAEAPVTGGAGEPTVIGDLVEAADSAV